MNGEGYKYHLHTGVERTNDKRSFIPRSPFFFFSSIRSPEGHRV